jgi:hypothetical protein
VPDTAQLSCPATPYGASLRPHATCSAAGEPPIPVFIHLRTWPNVLCSPSSGSRRREPLQRFPLNLHIYSRSSDRRAHGRPMRRCRVHGWPPRCRALLMFPVNAPGLHSPPFSVRSSPGLAPRSTLGFLQPTRRRSDLSRRFSNFHGQRPRHGASILRQPWLRRAPNGC